MADSTSNRYSQKGDTEPIYNRRDVLLICGLASGSSVAEIAQKTGMLSRSKTYRYLAEHNDIIQPMVQLLTTMFQTNKLNVTAERLEDYMAELRKLDKLSLQTFVDALMSPDKRLSYEAGKEHRDRVLGVPRGTVSIEGNVQHQVTHTLAPELRAALEADVLHDAALMQRRPLAIEGEIVSDDSTATNEC